MTRYTFIPNNQIKAVLVTIVATGETFVLCKQCFCTYVEIEEDSVSTATEEPQDDLTVEKFQALTVQDEPCKQCGKG